MPLSLRRRCRKVRGPDAGNSTSRRAGKPDARFRSGGKGKTRGAEPWGEPSPPPLSDPSNRSPNSHLHAGFSLTYSPPPAASQSPPWANGPQPQPRPQLWPRPLPRPRERRLPELASRHGHFLPRAFLLVKFFPVFARSPSANIVRAKGGEKGREKQKHTLPKHPSFLGTAPVRKEPGSGDG